MTSAFSQPNGVLLRRWCALACATAAMVPAFAFADGGAVLSSNVAGDLEITVFADPPVLRAGHADFSVLVQTAGSNDPVPGAKVSFRLEALDEGESDAGQARVAWVPPCCSMEQPPGETVVATSAAAQNKLLQAANVLIPTSGKFQLLTTVETPNGTATVASEIEALPPAPPALSYWPFLAFPPVAIGLFALRGHILRTRHR